MTCSNAPSLSVAGTVDYCTASGSCPMPLSVTLREVTSFEKFSPTIAGGTSEVITPGSPPANFLWITTVTAVRVQLNGGSEFIPVTRTLMITGDLTSVEIYNDVESLTQDVQVEVTMAKGTYL